MTIRQLRKALREIEKRQGRGMRGSDIESDHGEADDLLLAYIQDKTVDRIWSNLKLWYA